PDTGRGICILWRIRQRGDCRMHERTVAAFDSPLLEYATAAHLDGTVSGVGWHRQAAFECGSRSLSSSFVSIPVQRSKHIALIDVFERHKSAELAGIRRSLARPAS